MLPLDWDYTLRRIIEAPEPLRQSYAERLNLAKQYDLKTLAILPDDVLYRFEEKEWDMCWSVRTSTQGPYAMLALNDLHNFHCWYSSAGGYRINSLQDIYDAEHRTVSCYRAGSSGFDMSYSPKEKRSLRHRASFWPSHSGTVLISDFVEATQIAKEVQNEQVLIDTHLVKIDL